MAIKRQRHEAVKTGPFWQRQSKSEKQSLAKIKTWLGLDTASSSSDGLALEWMTLQGKMDPAVDLEKKLTWLGGCHPPTPLKCDVSAGPGRRPE